MGLKDEWHGQSCRRDEENDDEELAIKTPRDSITPATGIDEDESKDPSYNYIEISESEKDSEDELQEEHSESGESIADLAAADEDLPDILTMSREEREAFNQDEFFLKRMLKRNSDYVSTDIDLANEPILNRAINLLHHKRQGQNEITQILGVHINYDALPEDIKGAAISEKDFALRKEGKLRLEQKKTAMKMLHISWVKNDTKGQVSVLTQKQQGLSSGPVQNKGQRGKACRALRNASAPQAILSRYIGALFALIFNSSGTEKTWMSVLSPPLFLC